MLFADKQQLQYQLEVDLLALRQKELDHFTTCCLTLASPAALIAGFAYSGIAEVSIPEDVHWATEGLYYVMTVLAMLFQVAATVRASLVALMGPALALRGKAGSMHRSVEAMEPCFRGAWRLFLAGMFCIMMSTLINVFQQSQYWASATFVGVGICLATIEIYRDIRYVSKRFNLPPSMVERGAFTRDEVTSMFRGRRGLDRRRQRPSTRSATTTILIQAAEGVPTTRFARAHSRDVDSEASAGGRSGGGLSSYLASRAHSARSTSPPAQPPRDPVDVRTRDDGAPGAPTPARRARVTFSSANPLRVVGRAAAPADDATGGVPPAPPVHRRGSAPPLGAVAVLPPRDARTEGQAGAAMRWAGGSPPAAPPSDDPVHVVLTARDGKRLRCAARAAPRGEARRGGCRRRLPSSPPPAPAMPA